jgi:hypothetical protein
MFWPIIPFVSVLGYAFFAGRRFGVPDALAPLVACGVLTIFLFFAGLGSVLEPVTYGLLGLGIIFFIYDIVSALRGKVEPKWNSLTYIVITISYIIFMWVYRDFPVMNNDDFGHWALTPRDMLEYNRLLLPGDGRSLFMEYLPGPVLWSYFFLKAAPEFSEPMLFISKAMLMLSGFSVFLLGLGLRHWKMAFGVFAGLYILYHFFGIGFTYVMGVDQLLGLFLAAIVYVGYRYQETALRKFLILLPMLGILVLTKHMGVVFAAVGIGACFLTNINKRWMVYCSLMLGISLSLFYIWKQYTLMHGLVPPLKFDFIAFCSSFAQTLNLDYNQTFLNNYFSGFFNRKITPHGFTEYILISCFGAVMILVGSALLYYKHCGQKEKSAWIIQNVYLLVAFLGYTVLLMLIYLLSFSIGERVELASFDRYITPILLAWGSLVFISCIEKGYVGNIFRDRYGKVFAGIVLSLVFVTTFKTATWIFRKPGSYFVSHERAAVVRAKGLLAQKGEEGRGRSIRMIAEGHSEYVYLRNIIQYDMDSMGFEADVVMVKNRAGQYMSQEALKNALPEVEYVVLADKGERFLSEYGDLFAAKDEDIFRVVKNEKTGRVEGFEAL